MKHIFTLIILLSLLLGSALAQSPSSNFGEVDLITNVSVYPNPSQTGDFSVKFEINKPQDRLQIKVYNLIGREVYRDHAAASQGQFKTSFSLQHLPKGFYMLEVTIGDKRITRRLAFS